MDERDTPPKEGAPFVLWQGICAYKQKIMDLENRNATLQEELSLSPAKRAQMQTDWVPRAPAAYVLTGHRGQILKVAFHPAFNLIASASDDSTVKIWDWETGEFERTLKGHTRAVNDLDFDSKGNLLGECPDLYCVKHHSMKCHETRCSHIECSSLKALSMARCCACCSLLRAILNVHESSPM